MTRIAIEKCGYRMSLVVSNLDKLETIRFSTAVSHRVIEYFTITEEELDILKRGSPVFREHNWNDICIFKNNLIFKPPF